MNFAESSPIFPSLPPSHPPSLPPSLYLSLPLVNFLPLPHLSPTTFSLATLLYLSFLGAPFFMQNSFFSKTGARLPKALTPGISTPRKEVKATVLRKGADLPSESGVDDNDPLSLYQVLTSKTENSNKGKLLFDPHIWRNFADSGGGLFLSNKNYRWQFTRCSGLYQNWRRQR